MRHPRLDHRRLLLVLLTALALAPALATPAGATSPYYKDVCPSGCTYSDLQTAINSISGSDENNVYTIFIDAGVLNLDNSVTLGGRSYVNLIGRSSGASVLKASPTWFSNVQGNLTAGDLLDLSGSTHVIV